MSNKVERSKQYVVGLMFRNNMKEVALIRKARPDWQKGLLNGVGGKVEPGEHPNAAMVREFEEETGYKQPYWLEFLETVWGINCYVKYYICVNDAAVLKSITDEWVEWLSLDDIDTNTLIPNLRWIIPMALAFSKEPFYGRVDYAVDPATKQINESLVDPDHRQKAS